MKVNSIFNVVVHSDKTFVDLHYDFNAGILDDGTQLIIESVLIFNNLNEEMWRGDVTHQPTFIGNVTINDLAPSFVFAGWYIKVNYINGPSEYVYLNPFSTFPGQVSETNQGGETIPEQNVEIVSPHISNFWTDGYNSESKEIPFSFMLDLGNDESGTPYKLLNVWLRGFSSKPVSQYTFTPDGNIEISVSDILPGENFRKVYLEVETSAPGPVLTSKTMRINIPVANIAPSFKELKINKISQTDIKIYYELDLGEDEKGNPYELNSGIIILDKDKSKVAESEKELKGIIRVDGLTPGTIYDDWSAAFDTNFGDEKNISKNLEIFETNPAKIRIPFFRNIDLKVRWDIVRIEFQLNLGNNQKKEPYIFSDFEIEGIDGKNVRTQLGSDSGIINLKSLEPGKLYSEITLKAYTSFSETPLITKLNDFVVPYQVIDTSISSVNIIPDFNKATVNYILDFGHDSSGNPHVLGEGIEIYDNLNKLRGIDDDLIGSIEINNLIPGTTYQNWYLSFYSSANNKLVRFDLDDFKTLYSKKEPEFNDLYLEITESSAKISYQLFSGNNEQGMPYQLTSFIKLFDNEKNLLGVSSDKEGLILVDNLKNGHEYKGWYLETYTNSNSKAIIKEISPFKTYHIVEKSYFDNVFFFSSDKENKIGIMYNIVFGNDKFGKKHELKGLISIYDEFGIKISSSLANQIEVNTDSLGKNGISDWKIKAKVGTDVLETITFDLSKLNFKNNKIVSPNIINIETYINDNNLLIFYDLDLGLDANGNPYQTHEQVKLLDEKDHMLAKDDLGKGYILLKDLKRGKEYKGLSLFLDGKEFSEAIRVSIEDVVIPVMENVNTKITFGKIITKDNSAIIPYSISFGISEAGTKFNNINNFLLYDATASKVVSVIKLSDPEGEIILNNLEANKAYSSYAIYLKVSTNDHFNEEIEIFIPEFKTKESLNLPNNSEIVAYRREEEKSLLLFFSLDTIDVLGEVKDDFLKIYNSENEIQNFDILNSHTKNAFAGLLKLSVEENQSFDNWMVELPMLEENAEGETEIKFVKYPLELFINK